MNTVYNVIDSDVENGIGVMTFSTEKAAREAFDNVVKEYQNAYEDMGESIKEESHIGRYWAEIIINSDEVGKVMLQKNNIDVSWYD